MRRRRSLNFARPKEKEGGTSQAGQSSSCQEIPERPHIPNIGETGSSGDAYIGKPFVSSKLVRKDIHHEGTEHLRSKGVKPHAKNINVEGTSCEAVDTPVKKAEEAGKGNELTSKPSMKK